MSESPRDSYVHHQYGPWSYILLAFAAVLLPSAWFARHEPLAVILCTSIGVFFLGLAGCFRRLTVQDEGDALSVRFGPIPLMSRSIPYSEIVSVQPDRTQVLESWGVHMSPRGGWVWNIWGRDCVHIARTHGGDLRIGTDDMPGLLAFLESRILVRR